MTAQEMNAWLYYGDGLQLWEKVYKDFKRKKNLGIKFTESIF